MYVFDPIRSPSPDPNNLWVGQNVELERDRWYPSVYMIAELSSLPDVEPRLLVLGGDGAFVDGSGQFVPYSRQTNTYEAFIPPTRNADQGSFEQPLTRPNTQIFYGPADGDNDVTRALGFYPRMQLLADGKLFWAGFRRTAFWIRHEIAPETYHAIDDANGGFYDRNYACCLQFPNINPSYANTVVILGGSSSLEAGAFSSVQMCKGTALAAGCWPDFLSALVARERQDLLEGAFALLSRDEQELLRLRYGEGLSRAEIAEVVELPEATVRSRLYEAIARLRTRLEGE